MDFNQVHRKREIIGNHCSRRQCNDNAANAKDKCSSAQRVFVRQAGAIYLNSMVCDTAKYNSQQNLSLSVKT